MCNRYSMIFCKLDLYELQKARLVVHIFKSFLCLVPISEMLSSLAVHNFVVYTFLMEYNTDSERLMVCQHKLTLIEWTSNAVL